MLACIPEFSSVPLASYHSTILFPEPPLMDKVIDPLFIFEQLACTIPFPAINEGDVIVTDSSTVQP